MNLAICTACFSTNSLAEHEGQYDHIWNYNYISNHKMHGHTLDSGEDYQIAVGDAQIDHRADEHATRVVVVSDVRDMAASLNFASANPFTQQESR